MEDIVHRRNHIGDDPSGGIDRIGFEQHRADGAAFQNAFIQAVVVTAVLQGFFAQTDSCCVFNAAVAQAAAVEEIRQVKVGRQAHLSIVQVIVALVYHISKFRCRTGIDLDLQTVLRRGIRNHLRSRKTTGVRGANQ